MSEYTLLEASKDLISDLGRIGLWMQTLGIVIILWMIFEFIAFLMNRKRLAEVYRIKQDMARIEGKIDEILQKKGKKKK